MWKTAQNVRRLHPEGQETLLEGAIPPRLSMYKRHCDQVNVMYQSSCCLGMPHSSFYFSAPLRLTMGATSRARFLLLHSRFVFDALPSYWLAHLLLPSREEQRGRLRRTMGVASQHPKGLACRRCGSWVWLHVCAPYPCLAAHCCVGCSPCSPLAVGDSRHCGLSCCDEGGGGDRDNATGGGLRLEGGTCLTE